MSIYKGLRLPDKLAHDLDKIASTRGKSFTQVVVTLLEECLYDDVIISRANVKQDLTRIEE